MGTLTRLERLQAARTRLERALAVVEAEAPDRLPALVKEYRLTLAEIDAIETAAKPAGKGTALDELGKRRRAAGKPNASAVFGPEVPALGE